MGSLPVYTLDQNHESACRSPSYSICGYFVPLLKTYYTGFVQGVLTEPVAFSESLEMGELVFGLTRHIYGRGPTDCIKNLHPG